MEAKRILPDEPVKRLLYDVREEQRVARTSRCPRTCRCRRAKRCARELIVVLSVCFLVQLPASSYVPDSRVPGSSISSPAPLLSYTYVPLPVAVSKSLVAVVFFLKFTLIKIRPTPQDQMYIPSRQPRRLLRMLCAGKSLRGSRKCRPRRCR